MKKKVLPDFKLMKPLIMRSLNYCHNIALDYIKNGMTKEVEEYISNFVSIDTTPCEDTKCWIDFGFIQLDIDNNNNITYSCDVEDDDGDLLIRGAHSVVEFERYLDTKIKYNEGLDYYRYSYSFVEYFQHGIPTKKYIPFNEYKKGAICMDIFDKIQKVGETNAFPRLVSWFGDYALYEKALDVSDEDIEKAYKSVVTKDLPIKEQVEMAIDILNNDNSLVLMRVCKQEIIEREFTRKGMSASSIKKHFTLTGKLKKEKSNPFVFDYEDEIWNDISCGYFIKF